VQNSLYVQVLRSPILAALLHGTPAAGVSQTLRHGTRNGITELSLRAPPIRQGGHHVGHRPTFLVEFLYVCKLKFYKSLYSKSGFLHDVFWGAGQPCYLTGATIV